MGKEAIFLETEKLMFSTLVFEANFAHFEVDTPVRAAAMDEEHKLDFLGRRIQTSFSMMVLFSGIQERQTSFSMTGAEV